jgi:hypothetical protein
MNLPLLILSLASPAGAFDVKLMVGNPAVPFYADSEALISKSSFFEDTFEFE